MNEHIKRLAAQSGFWTTDKFCEGESAKYLEKFAELIVKDCMSICTNIEYYDDPGLSPERCGSNRAGAAFCRDGIKEHFGVK